MVTRQDWKVRATLQESIINLPLPLPSQNLRSDPLPFYMLFGQKRYPFLIPSIDKWHPFHIASLKLYIWLLWNIHFLKIWIPVNHKTGMFVDFVSAVKCIRYPFWVRFPYPFYIIQLVKTLPFHVPETWKRYPFRLGVPVWAITRSTPPPHPPPTLLPGHSPWKQKAWYTWSPDLLQRAQKLFK